MLEGQRWRHKRVCIWELQASAEVAAYGLLTGTYGEGQWKGWAEHTAVVFAVIVDHKHNLPFEYIAVLDQAARDSRQVLAFLNLLELAPQEGGGGGGLGAHCDCKAICMGT